MSVLKRRIQDGMGRDANLTPSVGDAARTTAMTSAAPARVLADANSGQSSATFSMSVIEKDLVSPSSISSLSAGPPGCWHCLFVLGKDYKSDNPKYHSKREQ
jgi:hypothetical protein